MLEPQNKLKFSFWKVTLIRVSGSKLFVVKHIVLRRKSHTVGENLIMPICKIIVIKMPGQDTMWGFGKIPVLNSILDIIISCHIMLKQLYVIIWKLQLHYLVDEAWDFSQYMSCCSFCKICEWWWDSWWFFFLLQKANWNNNQRPGCF